MHNFRALKIWQESMELAKAVYRETNDFPAKELYTLTSQINRSAISVPSNIAEGSGRNSDKEFIHFLSIAMGSSFELETQLILAHSFSYIKEANYLTLIDLTTKVQRMINGFKISLMEKESIEKCP